ncbi:MAG TPA: PAS domain S-box protein [Polyangia bacterium]|nr:PAS domain S-box protein [Polyangia bacterium]
MPFPSRALLDILADPVIASDDGGAILYANPAAGRLLGCDADDLVGKPLTSLMPARFHSAHNAGFRRFMSTGESTIMGRPIRVPVVHGDGGEIEVELTLSALPDDRGKPLVLAILRDLRERIELERKLASHRNILAQYSAVAVLTEATSAAVAIPKILESTARTLEWDVGIYWAADPDSGRLGLSATWSSEDEGARQFLDGCRSYTFAPGEGLPGLVFSSGQPMWSRDVRSDGRYLRAPLASRHGLRSALLFPVTCSNRTWGVLEYLSSRTNEPDLELSQTMAALGFQLGQFLERLENEEELRRAEERLRLAVEAAGVGTWDYDPKTGAVRADSRYRRLFGLGAEVPLTTAMLMAGIHPDDKQRVTEAAQRSFDPASGGEYNVDYRTRGIEDGLERWLAVRGRTIFDEQGRASRFLGTGVDITQEQRALDRLRFLSEAGTILSSSLDYRRTLAEVAALAVPHLADWCLVEVGTEDGATELVAVAHVDPAKTELAREIRRRYPPQSNAASGTLQVLATGRAQFVPEVTDDMLVAAARDPEHLGMLREVGLRSAMLLPLKVRDRPVAVLGLFQAESGRRYTDEDLKYAEELARHAAVAIENARLYDQATRAIGIRDQFLSIASHELRTPLTSLMLQLSGLARLVNAGTIRTLPVEKLEGRIARMEQQATRLSTLVDELLNVSRISAGRLALVPETTDLVLIVRDVVERFTDEAENAGSALSIDAPASLAGTWDRNRVDQVITNLVSNAMKYARGKPIHLGVRQDRDWAYVTVQDQGPGISKADQPRIFDQFERAAPAAMAGLGLGLWIASRIVDAHGGRIDVVSEIGEGASFTVALPLTARV